MIVEPISYWMVGGGGETKRFDSFTWEQKEIRRERERVSPDGQWAYGGIARQFCIFMG